MRRPEEFARAFDGVRARSGRVALYLGTAQTVDAADLPHAKVGFVVSKKVGNSVVRHRIARQLRHILRPWIAAGTLEPGDMLVVRIHPGAAGTRSARFEADMAKALASCRRKAQARAGARPAASHTRKDEADATCRSPRVAPENSTHTQTERP